MSGHEDLSRRNEVTGASDRSFGFVFAAFFAIVGLVPLLRHHPLRLWALIVGGVFLLIAIVRPSLLKTPNRLWTRLGLLLSKVVNPVVMGILFYVVVTPIAFLRRLGGADSLKLHFDPQAPTYWQERRPPGPAPESMARQF
jgi:hypothetical protein